MEQSPPLVIANALSAKTKKTSGFFLTYSRVRNHQQFPDILRQFAWPQQPSILAYVRERHTDHIHNGEEIPYHFHVFVSFTDTKVARLDPDSLTVDTVRPNIQVALPYRYATIAIYMSKTNIPVFIHGNINDMHNVTNDYSVSISHMNTELLASLLFPSFSYHEQNMPLEAIITWPKVPKIPASMAYRVYFAYDKQYFDGLSSNKSVFICTGAPENFLPKYAQLMQTWLPVKGSAVLRKIRLLIYVLDGPPPTSIRPSPRLTLMHRDLLHNYLEHCEAPLTSLDTLPLDDNQPILHLDNTIGSDELNPISPRSLSYGEVDGPLNQSFADRN